ncbi:MAG: ATP-dependent DNA helicase RecG, partial [Clostridia bacterium]|nr:ATP-dependent DNA helicase RecG [Clostridia bacterium]
NNNNFKLEPIYSQTKNLSSLRIKKFVSEALKLLPEKIPETIPEEFLKKFNLPSLDFVIKKIHFPESKDEIYFAKKRIIFEELVSWILSVKKIKNNYKSNFIISNFFDEFKQKLEFKLTNSQEKIILECINEMSSGKKMSRLLQGDVGSGKTVIAMALAYNTLKSGFQVAIMAPTEVLAMQHYNTFSKIINHENIDILTGSTRTKERNNIITKFMLGMPGILIGTHSLISDNIEFKKLALVITDEQHKFGVEQRKKLLNKGNDPHYLVMSATPIPRSLAMIIYGDLDISVINEMPKNRAKIKTTIIKNSQRVLAFKFIKKELNSGNQAYIVCSRVTENKNNNNNNELSEITEADVENYKSKIIKNYFENFNIGILHGKMSSYEKDFILQKFYDKKIDLLICTTVIEVGIDVPNATVIMIENAEKFGLASLHQMRGRVGRSEKESYCILICNKKSKNIIERLTTMQKSNDGFYLAQKDLEIRGPGDFFGTEQHGKLSASLISSLKNPELISQANEFINFTLETNFKFKSIKFFNQKT